VSHDASVGDADVVVQTLHHLVVELGAIEKLQQQAGDPALGV